MSRRTRTLLPVLCLVFSLITTLVPQQSHAFKIWLGARGDLFAVSSDLFARTEDDFAGGVEAGLGLGFIQVYLEALFLQSEQFVFSGNLGVDLAFGDTFSVHLGGFTGPMLFLFPSAETTSGGVDFSVLSSEEQALLLAAGSWSSLQDAEAEFDAFSEDEEDLGRLAFGWNLIRARVGLDLAVAGPLHLGIAGQLGYHLLLTGEEAVAGAKNEALEEFSAQNGLNSDMTGRLRQALGAAPVDVDDLSGFNYDATVYLRFEFGL